MFIKRRKKRAGFCHGKTRQQTKEAFSFICSVLNPPSIMASLEDFDLWDRFEEDWNAIDTYNHLLDG